MIFLLGTVSTHYYMCIILCGKGTGL